MSTVHNFQYCFSFPPAIQSGNTWIIIDKIQDAINVISDRLFNSVVWPDSSLRLLPWLVRNAFNKHCKWNQQIIDTFSVNYQPCILSTVFLFLPSQESVIPLKKTLNSLSSVKGIKTLKEHAINALHSDNWRANWL